MPISSTSCMLGVLFLHTVGTRSIFPCYPEEEKPMVSGSDQHASLPLHYAFVVQLATDTEIDTGHPARVHGPGTPRHRCARAGGRGRDATSASWRKRTA